MGLRYRKSMKVAPGIRLYLGKNGISTSFGRRGASISVGKRGTFLNVGLPGTGLSYRQRIDSTGTKKKVQQKSNISEAVPSITHQRTFEINYWSLLKYLIGLYAIYLVYNWTKLLYKSSDWPIVFYIFYVLALIIIVLVFYKPVMAIVKRVFRRKRKVSIQEMAKNRVQELTRESSRKIVSDILEQVRNENSNKKTDI